MQTRQHSVSILSRKIQLQLKSIWIGRKLNCFHRILKNYFTQNPFFRFFLAKKKCRMDKNVWSYFLLISVFFVWNFQCKKVTRKHWKQLNWNNSMFMTKPNDGAECTHFIAFDTVLTINFHCFNLSALIMNKHKRKPQILCTYSHDNFCADIIMSPMNDVVWRVYLKWIWCIWKMIIC